MNRDTSIPPNPPAPGFITNIFHAIALLFWWVLIRGLNRVRIVNPNNRPQRGEKAILICSNHVSALDPFIIGVTAMPFFSPVWWRAPAKEELFRWPVLRSILRFWGAFPVRRGRGDLGAIDSMAGMLQSSVIVIFPEGTRVAGDEEPPGRAGVGKLIQDAPFARVIPVWIEGSRSLLPKKSFLPRCFQKLEVIYGKPVNFSDLKGEEGSIGLSRLIVDRLMAEIRLLRPGSRRTGNKENPLKTER